jgi:hypothetical protein
VRPNFFGLGRSGLNGNQRAPKLCAVIQELMSVNDTKDDEYASSSREVFDLKIEEVR